jgi:hypothetical protein
VIAFIGSCSLPSLSSSPLACFRGKSQGHGGLRQATATRPC